MMDESYVKQLEERCAALEEKMVDFDENRRQMEYMSVLIEYFIDSKCFDIRKEIMGNAPSRHIAKPKNEEEIKSLSEHLGKEFIGNMESFLKESPRIRFTGYNECRDAIFQYIEKEFFK